MHKPVNITRPIEACSPVKRLVNNWMHKPVNIRRPLDDCGICMHNMPRYNAYSIFCSKVCAISFSFLPRDGMQARSLLSCSVRPSVTFVDHVKTNKHIFEIFSPSGSDTILVFPYQRRCRYSDGNPPNGASNARGYDKMTFFHKYLAVSQKR